MFAEPLPEFVNTNSARVSVGLGTIARVVANGAAIYRDKITFAEVRSRIDRIYVPYHTALRGLIAETQGAFGCAVLVDCHSMPSTGGPFDRDSGRRRGEIVLGDRFGTSCAGIIVDVAEKTLRGPRPIAWCAKRTLRRGLCHPALRTAPATASIPCSSKLIAASIWTKPAIEPGPGFDRLTENLSALMRALATIDVNLLRPPAYSEAAQ